MLRGPELLSKAKELSSMPKSEVVRACGYVSPRKDGSQRLNYTAFYEALLEAKGMSFGGAGESASRRDSVGRKLSYISKVHFNGNLLVGKAYTSMLGLKPGDEFDIKLERKGIRLIPKHRSEDMMAGASVSGEAPEEPSAAAPVAPAPLLDLETTASVAAQDAPLASPSVPPAPPVAPAPIPTPIPVTPPAPAAAPAAPPAPGSPPIPQQPAPVATSAPASPPSTAPQQPSPQTSPVDSWEDSLRKLDQSSRPERWDA